MRPRPAIALAALVTLAACAGPPVARLTLDGTGIPQICDAYADSSNPLERQLLEVELATRNVVRCPGTRIGAATASVKSPQRLFLLSGGPTRDIHGLDPDGDGLACGWGSRIARIAAQAAPAGD